MAKKILIIDDSQTIRKYVAFTAKRIGFEVIEAVDGKDGLEKIRDNPDLSLVICDLNMPEVNGYEVIAKSKSEVNPSLPIVVLTTEMSAEALERVKAAGAVGYISKPFKPDELEAIIKRVTGET